MGIFVINKAPTINIQLLVFKVLTIVTLEDAHQGIKNSVRLYGEPIF